MAINLPYLEHGKYVLLRADPATGIVLNNDGAYYLGTGENYYQIFDSIEGIKDHLEKERKLGREVEGLIYDNEGHLMEKVVMQ